MLDLREDPITEAEQTPDVPGDTDEDITTLDENGNTLNRHELELSLIRELVDTLTLRIDGHSGFTPIGGIIAYSGAEQDIPTKWQLCNGQQGTPDLRDKFIMGSTTNDIGQTGGSADIEQTLPEHSHRLDHHFHEIPEHEHTVFKHSHPLAGHSHSFSGGSHSHAVASHSHGMAHGHGATGGSGIITSSYNYLRETATYPGQWRQQMGAGTGDPGYFASYRVNGNEVLSASTVVLPSHTHDTANFSGNTGGAGSSTDSASSSGSVGSGGSGNTNSNNNELTSKKNAYNTENAGSGNTWPEGQDKSGTGKNIPPYLKLAYIQRME